MLRSLEEQAVSESFSQAPRVPIVMKTISEAPKAFEPYALGRSFGQRGSQYEGRHAA